MEDEDDNLIAPEGYIVGKYTLAQRLGAGAYGIVYSAYTNSKELSHSKATQNCEKAPSSATSSTLRKEKVTCTSLPCVNDASIHPVPVSSVVAIKIIRNQPAYTRQAQLEVEILLKAQEQFANDDRLNHVVRLLDAFDFNGHVCLVFTPLSYTLYEELHSGDLRSLDDDSGSVQKDSHSQLTAFERTETEHLIKKNFKSDDHRCTQPSNKSRTTGLSLSRIRQVCRQTLLALSLLEDLGYLHCDVKPENIMVDATLPDQPIRLIDFGSVRSKKRNDYFDIQSLWYRAPEVAKGQRYGNAIDTWSLGLTAVELYTASPLLMAKDTTELISLISTKVANTDRLRAHVYVARDGAGLSPEGPSLFDSIGDSRYEKASSSTFSSQKAARAPCNPSWPSASQSTRNSLDDLSPSNVANFVDFVTVCLRLDPNTRPSPKQALVHIFLQDPVALPGRSEAYPSAQTVVDLAKRDLTYLDEEKARDGIDYTNAPGVARNATQKPMTYKVFPSAKGSSTPSSGVASKTRSATTLSLQEIENVFASISTKRSPQTPKQNQTAVKHSAAVSRLSNLNSPARAQTVIQDSESTKVPTQRASVPHLSSWYVIPGAPAGKSTATDRREKPTWQQFPSVTHTPSSQLQPQQASFMVLEDLDESFDVASPSRATISKGPSLHHVTKHSIPEVLNSVAHSSHMKTAPALTAAPTIRNNNTGGNKPCAAQNTAATSLKGSKPILSGSGTPQQQNKAIWNLVDGVNKKTNPPSSAHILSNERHLLLSQLEGSNETGIKTTEKVSALTKLLPKTTTPFDQQPNVRSAKDSHSVPPVHHDPSTRVPSKRDLSASTCPKRGAHGEGTASSSRSASGQIHRLLDWLADSPRRLKEKHKKTHFASETAGIWKGNAATSSQHRGAGQVRSSSHTSTSHHNPSSSSAEVSQSSTTPKTNLGQIWKVKKPVSNDSRKLDPQVQNTSNHVARVSSSPFRAPSLYTDITTLLHDPSDESLARILL